LHGYSLSDLFEEALIEKLMVDKSEDFLSSAGIWMAGSMGHDAPEVFVPAWMCFRLLPA
jgi:hypothetical protein